MDIPYPRLPLREETLHTVTRNGAPIAVVTRNRYGAEVLNTDSVLIADVDRDLEPAAAGIDVVREVGRRISAVLGRAVPMAGQPEREPPLSPEQQAVTQMRQWAARRPSYGVRVYRTYAGLRVIVTGASARPSSEPARRILAELGSDPLYVELCAQHDTFRARLTPKPWRVAWRAPPVRWPYESDRAREEFAAWLVGYERASYDRSSCRLVATCGPQPVPGSADDAVVTLHDDASRATDGTPLA